MSSFQFGIFTEVLSTLLMELLKVVPLWVPFNLVFLPKFFQLNICLWRTAYCCEFLSIWYFYRSSFNTVKKITKSLNVVSSFQFGIFTEVLSTLNHLQFLIGTLWVPFNLVFLPKFFQHIICKQLKQHRCEFLSIWYFYRSSFNEPQKYYNTAKVVSSFQFGIFTEVLSTNPEDMTDGEWLWVPFNLVFLPKFFQHDIIRSF